MTIIIVVVVVVVVVVVAIRNKGKRDSRKPTLAVPSRINEGEVNKVNELHQGPKNHRRPATLNSNTYILVLDGFGIHKL